MGSDQGQLPKATLPGCSAPTGPRPSAHDCASSQQAPTTQPIPNADRSAAGDTPAGRHDPSRHAAAGPPNRGGDPTGTHSPAAGRPSTDPSVGHQSPPERSTTAVADRGP